MRLPTSRRRNTRRDIHLPSWIILLFLTFLYALDHGHTALAFIILLLLTAIRTLWSVITWHSSAMWRRLRCSRAMIGRSCLPITGSW